jgi:pSer/pThr/pTyr-binding forkhead associated (FHA) protein
MREGAYLIGRGPALAGRRSTIRLDDPTVSERHAELVVLNGNLYLTDLGSRNGTWRVDASGEERLSEGNVAPDDLLRIGRIEMRVRDLLARAGA